LKNIIFDLGNVLINYDFELFFERLGYKRGERSLAESHHLIAPLECGNMEIEDFISGMRKVYKSSLNREAFTDAWCDVFWENNSLIEAALKLTEHFRVMILSNNDELHFPYIWEKFSSLHFFQDSDIMISSRLRYIKPDIRIYHTAADLHDFEWKDSLFVDDKLENIEIARDLGAKGIWHVQDEKTLTELLKITEIK